MLLRSNIQWSSTLGCSYRARGASPPPPPSCDRRPDRVFRTHQTHTGPAGFKQTHKALTALLQQAGRAAVPIPPASAPPPPEGTTKSRASARPSPSGAHPSPSKARVAQIWARRSPAATTTAWRPATRATARRRRTIASRTRRTEVNRGAPPPDRAGPQPSRPRRGERQAAAAGVARASPGDLCRRRRRRTGRREGGGGGRIGFVPSPSGGREDERKRFPVQEGRRYRPLRVDYVYIFFESVNIAETREHFEHISI
jgi:hypothetical protein